MPAARRCFAVSPAAISGAAASRTAPPRPASSATPISSAPTARWAAAMPRADELADTIAAQWTGEHANRYVVLTGGEPLLQVDAPLIDALHARGFAIGVETNGTIEPPDGMDWICVSPKAGADLVVRRGHELKLVYPQADAAPEDFRRSRLRAFLAAADGRTRRDRKHRACGRLLPAPSAMAAQPADAQDTRHQIGSGDFQRCGN